MLKNRYIMKYLNYIIAILFTSVLAFSCVNNPNKEYKLTKQQKVRVHQGYEYKKNKIDKANEKEKEEWRANDKERLHHNRKVAASKDPKKKIQMKQKAAPFSHH